MEKKKKKRTGKNINRSAGSSAVILTIIIILGLFMAFPVVIVISNSLKSLDELWVFPPTIFPRNPNFRNYTDMIAVLSDSVVPFSRYILNTLLITVVGTLGNVILGSMGAYALSKLKFPGRDLIFNIIVKSLMFNATVTAIPTYIIMSYLGMVDTLWSIILPTFASTLSLYLMKQFMEQSIPDTMLEAARIDGASAWQIFWRMVMPNVKPAWSTAILLSVQSLWNVSPNTLIFSEEKKTLAYILTQVTASGLSRAGVSAAITVVMMSVPVAVFLISQSQVLETMATSGMKD